MSLWLNLLLFTVACVILVKSASVLLGHLPRVASFFRLNEFAIGFIIMAVSTSTPELFVGISSALGKNTALSLGNVIGSNIVDLTLIIGLVALFNRGIRIRSKIIRKDIIYMIAILLLPVVMMLWPPGWLHPGEEALVSTISRFEGILLLLVFIGYLYMAARQERTFHSEIQRATRQEAGVSILLSLAMVIILLASSHFVVRYATGISAELHVPPILIGLFLVAIGTSLPELSFEMRAVSMKHEEMALGDLIGSIITNSTLVLGATALIRPITANFFLFFTSAMFMIVIAFVFLTFAESDGRLTPKEAISLVMLYVLFIIVESYIKTLQ